MPTKQKLSQMAALIATNKTRRLGLSPEQQAQAANLACELRAEGVYPADAAARAIDRVIAEITPAKDHAAPDNEKRPRILGRVSEDSILGILAALSVAVLILFAISQLKCLG